MGSNSLKIKSFVLRQGKITPGQQRAIAELLPKYGLDYQDSGFDLNQVFGRKAPTIVEIGCGMGDATWQIAQNNPSCDYLALEVHGPGVGSLLMKVQEQQLQNLRIIRHDAVAVLQNMLAPQSISGFHIFFPDPWPKKRHHKRRLVQDAFVALLVEKLTPGGYIHLATDWQDYAQAMAATLSKFSALRSKSAQSVFIKRPDSRPVTKFERRGQNLGHQVWDLYYLKLEDRAQISAI
jgi:tRNA (guanine-N7-)-methyltransferase